MRTPGKRHQVLPERRGPGVGKGRRSCRLIGREGASPRTLLIRRGKGNPNRSLPFPVTSTQKQGEEEEAQRGRSALCRPCRALSSTGPPQCRDPTWPPSHHGPEAGLHLRLDAHWGGFPHHREDRWGDFSTVYGTKGRLVGRTLRPSAKPSLPSPRWLLSSTRTTAVTHRGSHVETRHPKSWLPACNGDNEL